MGLDELNWMIAHPEELEKYSGKWIGLVGDIGVVAADKDLSNVVKEFKKKFPEKIPCTFKVPTDDELLIVLWSNLNTKK